MAQPSEIAKEVEQKTLRGLMPHEYIRKIWTENERNFRQNPIHHNVGLYICASGDEPGRLEVSIS